jgi:Flp pilus assembly protein protease CpaA
MSSLALAVSGGVLALASLLLKRASERDAELLKEMFVCLKRSCP